MSAKKVQFKFLIDSIIAYGSIIEIAQRPKNTKAIKNKTKFFKVWFKCAMSIANIASINLRIQRSSLVQER